MEPLSVEDLELISVAKEVAKKFSGQELRGEVVSTVGSAVRAGEGKIYSTPNIYHTTIDPYYLCAEPLAIGKAYSDGHRELDAVVAYRYWPNGEKEGIIQPCDRCVKLLRIFGDPWIIVEKGGQPGKTRLSSIVLYS